MCLSFEVGGKTQESGFSDKSGLDWADYGARMYDFQVARWVAIDPMSDFCEHMSAFSFCINNPIRNIDPSGLSYVDNSGLTKAERFELEQQRKRWEEVYSIIKDRGGFFEPLVMRSLSTPPSTEVQRNRDGSYTVVGAMDDNDNNIYVVDGNLKRTGEIIGQTINPFDFMETNSETNKFIGYAKNVTFKLGDLPDGNKKVNKLALGWDIFVFRAQSVKSSLGVLAILSRNGGFLDIKYDYPNSTGGIYTAVSYNGKITTARTLGNILFGKNLRAINLLTISQALIPARAFYIFSMQFIGKYNSMSNKGNYNPGWPFYGEETYSGTGIYLGYFGKLPKN